MSTELMYERFLRALERYGFGIALATAILWFARTDIIVPMVDAHGKFLEELTISNREIAKTQGEISRLVAEQGKTLEAQTRILYTICPKIPMEAREYAQTNETSPEAAN